MTAGASDVGAAPACELLEWDSEHFGFPIARVTAPTLTENDAQEIDGWCRDHGIRCLYFRAAADDEQSAQIAAAHEYRFVDVHLTLRRSHEGLQELDTGPVIDGAREATEADLEFARGLARRSHRTSRFYFDGNFPRERCDALYEAWVERGHREPGRRLLIAVMGDQPIGYMVSAPIGPDREGHGELVAIDERYRGKGYGKAMHFAWWRDQVALGALSQRGVFGFRNLANIRLHERLGFLTDEVVVWHHKWYDEPESTE
jgi:GNAT superfamily N-acetyltransferase